MAKFSHLLCLAVLVVGIISCSSEKEKEKNGKKKDKEPEIAVYELKTEKMHARLTNWGASLMSFYVPDKNGNF